MYGLLAMGPDIMQRVMATLGELTALVEAVSRHEHWRKIKPDRLATSCGLTGALPATYRSVWSIEGPVLGPARA